MEMLTWCRVDNSRVPGPHVRDSKGEHGPSAPWALAGWWGACLGRGRAVLLKFGTGAGGLLGPISGHCWCDRKDVGRPCQEQILGKSTAAHSPNITCTDPLPDSPQITPIIESYLCPNLFEISWYDSIKLLCWLHPSLRHSISWAPIHPFSPCLVYFWRKPGDFPITCPTNPLSDHL